MSTGAVIARIITQYSDKGSKAAQRDIAKTAKKIDDFNKKVVKAYAAGAAAAAFFAYKVGKFAVQSAVEDAKSQEALANVLRNTTNATNTQIAAVEAYIEKQQLLTHVSDIELRKSLGTLVAITGDLTQAQYLNTLAVDIAAGANKDLGAVVNALAKAAQGNLTPLKKLNLGLDNNTIASKDFAGAFGKLEKMYGGAAERIAKKDPFTKLKIQFGEIAEKIGVALLPALSDLAFKIETQIVPKIEDWVDANKTLITQSLLDLAATIENIAYYGFSVIKFLEKFQFLLSVIAVLAPFGFIASQLILVGKLTKAGIGLTSRFLDKLGFFGKDLRTAFNIVKGNPAKGFLGFFKNLWNIISLIVPQARALKIAVTVIAAILGGLTFKAFFNKNNSKSVEKTTAAMEEQGRTALRYSKTTRLTAEQLKKKNKEEKDALAITAANAKEQARQLELQKKSQKYQADYDKINKRIAENHKVKLLSSEEEKLVQINAAEALLNRQKTIDAADKERLSRMKEEILSMSVRNELAKRYQDILTALADQKIDPKEVIILGKLWGVPTEAAQAYVDTILAIEDATITDDEIVNLAKTWGSTQAQAAQYLDFFQALNDGYLSDAEINKLMSKWKLTQDEVLMYADFVGIVNDGKLEDAEIIKIQGKWKLTVDQVVDYIKKIGAPVSYSGTLIDPARAAEIGWLNATAALQRYLDLLKAGTGVVIPKNAPGGFVPGSGEDPTVIAAAESAAAAAAAAAADADALLAESEAAAKAAAARSYAIAKAAGDMDSAAIAAAQVGPSALAAGESGAIGAASIAAALKAAEQALQNERIMSTYASFKAKEAADALASSGTSSYANSQAADDAERARFRALTSGSTMAVASGISGGNLMAAPVVNITVQGSVTAEQDLVQTVRNGLLAAQYNGNQINLQAI